MKKILLFAIIIGIFFSSFSSAIKLDNHQFKENIIITDDTEYWALLVGCTEFDVAPIQTLGGTDRVVGELNNLLIVSDHWKQDHIKILTGKNATKKNIINGLKWLDEMDDSDDVCFFFISTHGTQGRDLFPKDEADEADEYLLTYDSYRFVPIMIWMTFPWRQLRDDEINRFLDRLDSKGVFVIVDSCFSGGFNDPPRNSILCHNSFLPTNSLISLETWNHEFGAELRGPGRVILMSGGEDKITQGLCFTYFAMEGMQGRGDVNHDSICTAEEIFAYASPLTTSWLKLYKNWVQYPQMYDDYPGELPVTWSDLPPDPPTDPLGPYLGMVDNDYYFSMSAIDPEGDCLRYHINWDDGVQDITDFAESGESVEVSHCWTLSGTYNVWLETEDEHHAMIYQFGMPKCFAVSIGDDDDNFVDQYQSRIYQPQGFYDCMIFRYHDHWMCSQAQSFVPTFNVLTKVDLWVGKLVDISYPLTVAIRANLSGEDLTFVTNDVPFNDLSDNIGEPWVTFDFLDITVNPGETYYIVCYHPTRSGAQSYWLYGDPDYPGYPFHDEDPYVNGQAFKSEDGGLTWIPHTTYADDFCFVTYGKNGV